MTDAHFVEPMPCLAVKKLPEGEAWEYERSWTVIERWRQCAKDV
jgi:hypothetical protein